MGSLGVNYSPQALGLVVRKLREAQSPRLTQRELGVRAGYGEAGAGVAISRIESGLSSPSPNRLVGLNDALDLFPGGLVTLAARRTEELAAAAGGSAGTTDESLRERLVHLQRTVEERTGSLSSAVDAFNEAHDKARDEFFLPFVRAAEAITGAPSPPTESLEEAVPEEGADAATAAAFRLRFASYGVAQTLSGAAAGAAVGSAAGAATAYATFTAAVTWGTASTGVAISGLSGVAASNAALALLGGGTLAAGGAGVAGGAALLTGLVAGPALVLALSGLVWVARRNRQQRLELSAKLDEAQAHLDAQSQGVEAFTDLVGRAAQILEYVAVHGAHARERWSQRLQGPTRWDELSPGQQQQYDDFVQLCAAQLAVAGLDAERLLVLRGEELDQEIGLMGQILDKCQDLVHTRV